jgi:hypothetical protein
VCLGNEDRLTTSPPSLKELSRGYGILIIAQAYVDGVLTSQKHRPPRSVTGITLRFYILTMFVLRRKHRPPRSVTGIALLFYM